MDRVMRFAARRCSSSSLGNSFAIKPAEIRSITGRQLKYEASKATYFMGMENPAYSSSVRHYANAPAPADDQDPLKRIFHNMMNKYKTMITELTKSKITLDPDDDKAVSDYKDLMDGARKKVGLPSKTEKIGTWIDREAAAAPDVKSFFKSLSELKARLGVKEQYEGDKLLLEAVEKVEKKIGRVLIRGDKEGMNLLSKEFDAINKSLGINPNSLKDLEGKLDAVFAKAELEHMKKEVVQTIETHKKRHGLEEIQVDLKKLDHRNYL